MKYCLVVVGVLISLVSFSQETQEDLDKLKIKLALQPADTNRVRILCDLSYRYKSVNVDSTLHYATQALALSKQLKYQSGIAWSYLLIGTTHAIRNRVPQAISNYQKSIDLADSIHNHTIMCRAMANIGWCMYDLGDYYRAINYFKRSLDLQNRSGKQDNYFITLQINIGQTYLVNDRLPEAEKYLNGVLAYKPENIPNYGYLVNMLAALRIKQQRYDSADSLLTAGWHLIDSLPDKIDKADNRYYFAQLSLIRGDVQRAFAYAEESLRYSAQIGSKNDLEHIYKLLSTIESKRGRTQQALNYLLQSNIMRDSIDNSLAKYSEYLFNEREHERELLIQQKDKELLEADKQNERLMAVGLLVVSAIIISGLLFFVWQRQQANKKLLRTNQRLSDVSIELSDMNIELSGLNEELVNKEAAIAQQNNLLREMNDSKNKLFAIIGHDLRAPINSLQALMGLLITHHDLLTREEMKKYFHELNRSLKNLNNLTGNLLEWSFSQTNTIEFTPEIFDVAYALKENEELLTDLAQNKKIAIVNETQPGLWVWAHRHSINTVIRNLISNAIKFTHEGGKVTIYAVRLDGFIKISVIDNGVGMQDATKNTIFKIGEKRSTPGTANEKGSGLGLLLCKEFVENNGGTIDMETTLGKGSTFYFTIPIASPANIENNSDLK